MGKRANRRTPGMRNLRVRNRIRSRIITNAKKTEEAWEAQRAESIREFVTDTLQAGVSLDVVKADLRRMQLEKWPTKNKTKRGFLIFGITKSMLSRSRRHLNEITVAD